MILPHKRNSNPVALLPANSTQNSHRIVDVADNHINAAIVIEVAKTNTAGQVVLFAIASNLAAYITESPAEVLVEDRRLLACDAFALWVTNGMTVGHEEIFPTIEIDIDERC